MPQGKHLSAIYQLIKRGKTSALPSCYSRELQGLVARMLSRDPNERPSTQELLQDELLR
jgi:serine/threonine protein kinase